MNESLETGASRRSSVKYYIFALTAAVFWGLGATLAKYLLAHGVSPLPLTQVRQTLSFLLMMAFIAVSRPQLARIGPRDIPYLAVMGIGGIAMVQITYYSAVSRIQVAAAVLLQYMSPVFILVFAAVFMREKVTSAKLASLVMAVTGCALVAGVYKVDLLRLNIAGVSWGLLSAVFFSFYTLYGQAGLRKYNAMTIFAYSCGFGSVLWWTINPPASFFSIQYSGGVWLAFIVIAVFGTIVPFISYFKSLEGLEASRVIITSTFEPVVAGVASFLFLAEVMDTVQILGGVLVLIAIVLLQRSPAAQVERAWVTSGTP
ncbi:MAG: DMT family transporter [Candidatus Abyssubacteria bacterium]